MDDRDQVSRAQDDDEARAAVQRSLDWQDNGGDSR
jgi:hypothetical protein